MADFNSLLQQAAAPNPEDAPATLAETLRKHAKNLTDDDLYVLVEGLRTQRERWNAEQRTGSRKLVKSKDVPVKPTDFKVPAGFKPPVI